MKTAFLWKFSILCTKCDSKSPFFQLNENLFSYDNGMQDDFIVRSHIFVYFNFYFALIVVRHPVYTNFWTVLKIRCYAMEYPDQSRGLSTNYP